MNTTKERTFEAVMQLRDLKVGDVVTEKHMKALEDLIPLEVARAMPLKKMTIDFTSGEPKLTENELGVGVSVNGKEL